MSDMSKKWPLFTGILFLIPGVLLRIFTDIKMWPILIIVTGAFFKILYIINKIRNGEYKPGYEMVVLYIGLVMFFAGVFLRNHHSRFNHMYLMVPGISCKVFFIFMFIKKSRTKKVVSKVSN